MLNFDLMMVQEKRSGNHSYCEVVIWGTGMVAHQMLSLSFYQLAAQPLK